MVVKEVYSTSSYTSQEASHNKLKEINWNIEKKFSISVFLILLTVTVCVTIVCTYFLLNAEDYRLVSK